MSETTSAPPKKKGGGAKAKKPSSSATHPKVAEMVSAAISTLKERNGSSLQAIKKYIATAYKVDVEKLAPFIRRYLKSAVVNGKLIQTKGKGASGSFKLGGKDAGHAAAPAKKSKPAAQKKAEPKKPVSPKKKTAKPKSVKKASKVKAKRSPTKAKTPKPKKTASKAGRGKASSAPKQSTAA